MQEYPVYRPEKYSGVNLILSNSSYDYRPTQSIYVDNHQSPKNYRSYSPTNPIIPQTKKSYIGKNQSPPMISKPQGSSKAE